MRKVLLTAIVAAALVPSSAFGFAYGLGEGAKTAPGQVKANDTCSANFDRHEANVAWPKNGPKAGEPGQENCDHYWQATGAIGPDK